MARPRTRMTNGRLSLFFYPDSRGVECGFYKAGRRAFKCFRTKTLATFAWRKQKQLAKHGLAPKTLSEVIPADIRHRKIRRTWWDTIGLYGDSKEGWGYWTEIADTRNIRYGSDFLDLDDRLNEFEMNCDLHLGNVGRLNGRMVLIDTGRYSSS